MTMAQHERADPAPSLVPHVKIASGALAGGVASIAVWGIGLTGVDMPPAIGAAIATVTYAAIAYLVPSPAS
jgi:hypothetical protein